MKWDARQYYIQQILLNVPFPYLQVETIGDSYVAVTGVPNPQDDHAVRAAEFALECRSRMAEVVADLSISLGPDTGDLCMRFGLHSGPVTAGVLMGERARFQLFGDTVNTVSARS